MVSVIIPTYNRSAFLTESINSVLNQSFNDIEIVIVDDNGKSSHLQKENAKKLSTLINDNKIKYIAHEHNLNGSAARNTGIKNSRGDYIAFLDDDDLYEPTKIEHQLNDMISKHSLASLSYFTRFYGDKGKEQITIDSSKITLENVLRQNVDTCSGSSLIVSRKILDMIGFFDESFTRMQDIEFLARICKVTTVTVCEEYLTNVRMHSDNESNNVVDGKKYEKTILHFIDKFRNEIDLLNDKKTIISDFYYRIAKNYLKNKHILKFLSWLIKTKRPIKYAFKTIRDLNASKKRKKVLKAEKNNEKNSIF